MALVLLVVAASAVVVLFWLWTRSGRPQRAGVASLAGLASAVEVRFDGAGVPALRAASELDAAAALGWLHANDRLFQMELTRHAATGRLGELFGERALAYDRRVVRLGVRRTTARLFAAASPRTRELLEAYAAGVNAWMRAHGNDLPPEFRLLGRRPEPWRATDSLAVIAVMARTLSPIAEPPEEELFGFLRAFGAVRARELAVDSAAAVFAEVEAAALATAGPSAALEDRPEGADLGSNNWVVAPERSASGEALVANDPHLNIGLPNVWYQARISAPDYEASGMTLPGAPAVVLGRGPRLAWACTNLYIDDVDLYLERLDATGTQVQRGEGWVPIASERETIRASGHEESIEVRWTDRGLFLGADSEHGLPPRSVAWAGFEPADQLAAIAGLARARTLDEVPLAIAPYAYPAQNLVVAGADGGILWTPLGRGPDRFGWDGRFPAPGWRPDVGWRGLLPAAHNPVLRDPPEGAIATANSRLPIETPAWFGADFDTPFRVDRIRERLLSRRDWTVDELAALQVDDLSLWARTLVGALGDGYTGDAAKAAAALASWDGKMAVRGPAALFALVERELQRAVFADEAHAAGLPRFGTRKRLAALLDGRIAETWFDDVSTGAREARHETVEKALAAAWRQATARWGESIERWPYGAMHRLVLDHPLGGAWLVGRWLARGPYELPGSATTVLAFGGPWRGDEVDVTYGPSMRFVTSAADPEATRAVIPGGQSGHPFDAHYDDQIDDYLAGRTRAVPWSAEAVARAAVSTLRLMPEGSGRR